MVGSFVTCPAVGAYMTDEFHSKINGFAIQRMYLNILKKIGIVLLHLPNAKNVWGGERDTGLICSNFFFRYKWVGREGEEGKAH